MTANSGRGWAALARWYGLAALLTGAPCVAIALYLRQIAVLAGWFSVIVGVPLLFGAATAVWAVTIWPLVLLLAVVFGGRGRRTGPGNPAGPGVIVCI